MRKIWGSSILVAEFAAFGMLILLFFLNTSKPYLLLIPIAGVIGGTFLFNALLRKTKAVPIQIGLSVLFGVLIAAAVIGLIYSLR